jgi:hypothetical protein
MYNQLTAVPFTTQSVMHLLINTVELASVFITGNAKFGNHEMQRPKLDLKKSNMFRALKYIISGNMKFLAEFYVTIFICYSM